jgi:hypothetical protein
MRARLIALSLIVAIMATFTIAPLSAGAAPKPKPTGGSATLVDAQGTLIGTVTNLKAVFDAATGNITISGILTTATGVFEFSQTLVRASGSCEILRLDLGPLFLDLLGLQVDLSRVVLVITAQSGPGNLLGNLLCAVANLLNGRTPGNILTDLLNQIFRLV